jgi:coproporphyrinogen III oxidase
MLPLETIETGFRAVQDHISAFMVGSDGRAYREDVWSYEHGSGGGVTRVWEQANLLEKGGVNFSAIRGAQLPSSAATQFKIPEGTPFAATGVSLVMHPWNPQVPTIHMNIRYFEAGDVWWFGGGIDLTPYYPVKADVIAFHRALKELCDRSCQDYAAHKKACDEYFYIPHRQEARGVGGVFFDHLRGAKLETFDFVKALGMAFTALYGPIVAANRDKPHTEAQRAFQVMRRGRYAEFNLVYDRGTRFGLQSGGRIESILMSMPPAAAWLYDWRPEPGTAEAELVEYYLKPKDWAGMEP